jgi:hypothetical protein
LKALEELINMVTTSYPCELAGPDATRQLGLFEKRAGFSLPPDLRAFHLRVRRANISDCYELLPVELFQRTGAALQGPEWEDSEPISWYTFCDVHDGNFVGIDLEGSPDGHNQILDCDHDDIPSRRVIATCFAEFLERALRADGQLYYLSMGAVPTIDVPDRPPLAWLRREYRRWSTDPEIGPQVCRLDGCGRFCVSLSVHCRRHHFEAIQRRPYPFDD